MENTIEEETYGMNNAKNFFIGLVIGGLAGTVAMLLFAPESGKQTRALIQLKSDQLWDRTTGMAKGALAQARLDTDEIKAGIQEKATQLKQRGQDELVKQLDRASAALDDGKKAVEAA
jgi:gas vesicle protein